jgi:hypothetical protein
MRLQSFTAAVLAATLTASCAAAPTVTAEAAPSKIPAAPGAAAALAAATPSEALVSRAEAFVAAFNSKTPVSSLFVTGLTEEQRKGLGRADATLVRMRDRFGPILGIDRIEAETPYKGWIHVNLESRQSSFRIGVEPQPPHAIIGMELGR